ncbi:ABC transporter permease subunit [Natronorubrum bangense]|uniref:ABC transporter n=2 Tax=Natronorubrum bangense TaxID=61858 RepID=L9WGF4_9EURY|nr:ABC transporter permease subunit [Natronorubrum bangense]ELY48432.1 ABC transporter [Natronorubrum bangense JCM 10635]QCC53797.1 ABC transporter [Natronorubrum bangense]
MTWLVVAKKDFRDAVQSRALWALVAVFVVVSIVSTYAYVEVPELFGSPGGATFGGLIFFTIGLVGLFVPLAAIVVCYKSLAGERELGSIKLLLSLPTTRGQVFAGKVVGRAAVLAFGLGVGLLVGLGFGAALLGEVDIAAMGVFVLATVGFTTVYASIVVGISATTGSTSRATTLALGFFVVFELLWDVIPMGLLYVVEGFSLPAAIPDWVYPVMQVSPSSAYFSTIVALLPDVAQRVNAEPAQAGVDVTATEAEPFYTSPEIGIVVLAGWLVVSIVVGYVLFDKSDF